MAQNEDNQSSKPSSDYSSSGDSIRVGIVKKNQDDTRSGMIEVYLAGSGASSDSEDGGALMPVRYLSPFSGTFTGKGSTSGDGNFVGNPMSYGFWATAPDIGTEVICVFPGGRIVPGNGYYIGCVPPIGGLSMIPAIGASSSVVPNGEEATTYGGVDRLPTTNVNLNDPSVAKSGTVYDQPKPVHSYQSAIFENQGLIRDKVRGPISSSAQRESPSKVFGFSTPGGLMFEGGYNAKTASQAVGSADESKLKAIGRTGGHTFVMDDGDLYGADNLVRIRTASGHQIMMNDSEQTLFIIHSNGDSWIELGKEGTIDIFSKNSFNVRTEGDLNLHADKNVNINAGKDLQMYAGGTMKVESVKDMAFKTGTSFQGYAASNYSFKIGGSMIMNAGGKAGVEAGGTLSLQGTKVNLNSGGSGLTAAEVPSLTKVAHVDAAKSPTVGWIAPAPKGFKSVTSRAPTHHPWPGAGKGIPK
jgi:hypothetical protein